MITEASVEGLELLESLLKSIKEMKRMANYCYSITYYQIIENIGNRN